MTKTTKKNEEQLELNLETSLKDASSLLGNFGRAVFRVREHRGLTQGALGRILHVDGSSVGHWERGDYRPTPPCLDALLQWAPSLKNYPLPSTDRQAKPPGWPGEHVGVKKGKQPATKAKPNRIKKVNVSAVGDALHRAEKKRRDRVAVNRCACCMLALDEQGCCTNHKCKLSPLEGTPMPDCKYRCGGVWSGGVFSHTGACTRAALKNTPLTAPTPKVPVVSKPHCQHCGALIRDNGPGKGIGCSNTQCKFFVGDAPKKRINPGTVCGYCDGRVILGSFVHTENCDRPIECNSCGTPLDERNCCQNADCPQKHKRQPQSKPRTCSCGSPLNVAGQCTRPGCVGVTSCCRNPFGGKFCSNPDCVNRLGQSGKNAASRRLLLKYSAFIGFGITAASASVRRALIEFLREAEGNGITLREIIEVIGEVS